MQKVLHLDEKDRKLLLELDKNSRQSDSEIAKKVGVSKQVANYRIQKLIENQVITNFYTIINIGKLGYNSYYVFLQLEKINKEQERILLERLNLLDYVGWLVSSTGRWDAVLLIYADSNAIFDRLLTEIVGICGEHLHEFTFSTLVSAEHISYKLLGETEEQELHSLKQTEKLQSVKLEEIDKDILKTIDQNARLPLIEISKKIKRPPYLVNYHLKRLIREKIIEGFKPKINVNKLGYQWHLLLIQFQKTTEKRKREFISFCKQHNKVYYVTNTIGTYNLMLDIHIKTIEEFREILLELKEKFYDIIKFYESMVIFNEYKIDYFPNKLIK